MNGNEAAFVAAAATSGGTSTVVTALIAAGAAIGAAIVTAVSSTYIARHKVVELELSNSFDLAKQYLESARNYSQTVYLPLAAAIYKLHNEFLALKAAEAESVASGAETGPDEAAAGEAASAAEDQAGTAGAEPVESAESRFRTECNSFILTANDLFYSGAGAVLTLRLDERITIFVSFLQESLRTQRVVKSSFALRYALKIGLDVATVISPALALISPAASALINVGGIKSPPKDVIAAAPVTSNDFEKQFILYIDAIKACIKEVTLGGYKATTT